MRDTRVIRDTHVNTYLALTDDCHTGTGPGFQTELRCLGTMTTLHTILGSHEGKRKNREDLARACFKWK